ncbi:MAG: hypothetical protein SFV23_02790 [Planctomycetaceae bacterium]|nr:hypothetical protein [Planctomycetaceae bacterium]
MLRASGFAVGLFIAMWGVTFLYVDKLVLFDPPHDQAGIRGMLAKKQIDQESRPVVDPADWTAFTLMSIGSVTMLYSVALPKKSGGG